MFSSKTCFSGVVGHNISYSLSPIIHNYWYHSLNINGVYLCFDILEKDFDTSVRGLFSAGCKGINVTIPFKQKAFEYADILTPEAKNALSVNCLYKNNKGVLVGHNTDGTGFFHSLYFLDKDIFDKVKTILVIGAGGAARGIIASLRDHIHDDTNIFIYNRTFQNASNLAFSYNSRRIQPIVDLCVADLVIQTTPSLASLEGTILNFPEDIKNSILYVVDINYKQKKNNFLEQFPNHIKKIDGLEMLLQQAAPSFALFNHVQSPEINNNLRSLLLNSI